MIKKDDWRLRGQETYLKGVTLVHIKYRINNKKLNWDHDHCEFCWATIDASPKEGVEIEGYTDGIYWICSECYQKYIVEGKDPKSRFYRA